MLAAADSLGCFQVESRAQMNLLPRLRPRTMHDLIVDVSLIRPGPVQGGMARAYLERRAGRAPVAYWHAALEPVLAETLGALLGLDQDVHPLALLRPQLASQGIATTRDVGTLPHGARVRVGAAAGHRQGHGLRHAGRRARAGQPGDPPPGVPGHPVGAAPRAGGRGRRARAARAPRRPRRRHRCDRGRGIALTRRLTA
ncbi:MAG: hypothetical protein DYG90_14510 [Chloroflexi bacterium CFX6]|nr:hypothetical protein [Chloroflexi bacterium CFX6]